MFYPPFDWRATGSGAGVLVGADAGGPRNSLIESEMPAPPSQAERRSVPPRRAEPPR